MSERFQVMRVTESMTAVGFFIHHELAFDSRSLTRMSSSASMRTGQTPIEIAPPHGGGLAWRVLRRTRRLICVLW